MGGIGMNKQEIEKAIEDLKELKNEYWESRYYTPIETAISALEHQLTVEPTASEFLSKAKAINEAEAQTKDDFCKTIFTIIDYITGADNETSESDLVRKVMDYRLEDTNGRDIKED
jgi:phage gp36-like protein